MTVRCGICGRAFDDEAALAGHVHTSPAPQEGFACPVCGETLPGEEELVRHQGADHVAVDLPDEGQAVP